MRKLQHTTLKLRSTRRENSSSSKLLIQLSPATSLLHMASQLQNCRLAIQSVQASSAPLCGRRLWVTPLLCAGDYPRKTTAVLPFRLHNLARPRTGSRPDAMGREWISITANRHPMPTREAAPSKQRPDYNTFRCILPPRFETPLALRTGRREGPTQQTAARTTSPPKWKKKHQQAS